MIVRVFTLVIILSEHVCLCQISSKKWDILYTTGTEIVNWENVEFLLLLFARMFKNIYPEFLILIVHSMNYLLFCYFRDQD